MKKNEVKAVQVSNPEENLGKLIPVTYCEDRPTILARDLHKFLEVKTAFKDWFPRMCEYGFNQGIDFNPLKNEQVRLEGNRQVTRKIDDAQLPIDMAKEICMLQRNERGKQARQYFIQIEKDWNSPMKVLARANYIMQQQLGELQIKTKQLEAKIEEDKDKVEWADACMLSNDACSVEEFAKATFPELGLGRNKMFAALRSSGFLMSNNLPYQTYMDSDWFKVIENSYSTKGTTHITFTVRITPKGQRNLLSVLKS